MTQNSKNIFPALFIFGVILLILGAGTAYFNARFNVLTLALTCAGAISLVLAVLKIGKPLREILTGFQIGQMVRNLLTIAGLCACLIAVNIFANIYNLRLDLTKLKQHSLSQTTQDIIRSLNREVVITVFHVGIPPYYLTDILGEYERLSRGMIKAKIVDPLVDIGYAAQFGNVITGDERKAVIQSGTERRDIEYKDVALSEEQLTNTIIKVAREKRKVYFLSGHGEYNIDDSQTGGLSTLKTLLENRNFSAENFVIGSKTAVPDDCDALVIAGPKNPLPEHEEKILKDFLKNGGEALILIESIPVTTEDKPLTDEEKSKNPPLNSLLNPWGVKIGDDIVVDLENYAGSDVGCPVTRNYPKHKEIVRGLDYTFFIRPRSISILPDHPLSVKIAPLILTSSGENSWAETNRFLHVKFDENDTKGPITLGAVIWEPKNESKSSDTKVIVYSDADFASNAFIEHYSNSALVLNSLSWLSDLEQVAAIDAKPVTVEKLELTSKQIRLIILVLITIPLVIACAGIIVWWKQTS